jgi:hypothetical protein
MLSAIKDYLRKELKVPLYSEMYDDKELLARETEQLFESNPKLEGKLNKLRSAITKVRDAIKASEDVHVSFGVFEPINMLSEAHVREYRLLECLKVQKFSFQPSFDDSSSSNSGGAAAVQQVPAK